ncbi:GNAT family N-acetyltransferase [Sphaerisporangium viridialbum]|uniref:GNAT family N-acetyltransferase n=1 Tax=Sphaerisporangium viridialbum TaxID=46189 RepID=UPI003C75DF45
MTELGPVAWPPAPIRTERLVLREPEARDRAALIELFTSSEVGTYIGGPRPRDEFERAVPEVPRRRPGLFVVDLDGAMIGIITFDRRDAERPGHVRPDGGEAELGYMFMPEAWGCGYAAESCAAALDWFAGALPSEPVVLCTQTANDRSMRLAAKLGSPTWSGLRSTALSSGSACAPRSRRLLELVLGRGGVLAVVLVVLDGVQAFRCRWMAGQQRFCNGSIAVC